ncbi:low-affinity Zn(2+) transporter zrt2 [Teratosphaeriaceae sp. CCFEE 6253]|nr:low-affinity Zn(2+) transporter zrt2 [Teratosphaeriaceae sp. CCFEE 6253]
MSTCESGNGFDGKIGTRISAIFVILIGSFLGAWFPVFAARHRGVGIPGWAFFIAKYFGSGVIVATAFIHLLAPANEALGDSCLTGVITQYPWVEAVCLMVVFVMFFVELMTMRYARFGHDHEHSHGHGEDVELAQQARTKKADDEVLPVKGPHDEEGSDVDAAAATPRRDSCAGPHVPGDDHLSHTRGHGQQRRSEKTFDPESYSAQLTAIGILEFGVIFHSIFIGLTLAVAGAEFPTLYVVLVFHQTFEGLALGTRLASIEWPQTHRWTPYTLGLGYAVSTPIAISIGLGVRTSFAPGSATTLVVNGIFDSISAGILVYTGLIELMAHEFMFSEYMQKAPIREVLAAIGCMALGAALMALLGKWA